MNEFEKAVPLISPGTEESLVNCVEAERLLGGGDEGRGFAGPTGGAGRGVVYPDRRQHSLAREVAERIGTDVIADLFDGHVGGDEVTAVRGVDAVIARVGRRRARNTHMHLEGADFADHLDDLFGGRAADDGIIDQNDSAAVDQILDRIEFQPHAE